MESYQNWTHVFKLDPNKEISDKDLEAICESGTDAVIVGGTDGVTLDNTLNLLSRIRQHVVDCALEVTQMDAVTPGFDYYLIPSVLNAQNTDWVVGKHHEAVKAFGHTVNWSEVLMEGYCVLNPDSKVAKLTQAETQLDFEDLEAYAMMAEKMYHFPIFYIEYSGTYGDLSMVKAAKRMLSPNTRLFYGGGITSGELAQAVAEYADTVIVGNIIYKDIKAALKTVHAVKEARSPK